MPKQPNSSRWRRRIVALLAVLILVPSMWGFFTKFMELVILLRSEGEGAFAIAPITNYLLASAGFLLLLGWAAMNGMFTDIERPKYTMLENERRFDQQRPPPAATTDPAAHDSWSNHG